MSRSSLPRRSRSIASPRTPRRDTVIDAAIRKRDRDISVSFHKELASVMYGFGDLWNPLPETVDLMNAIVEEYIEELVKECLTISTGKLDYPTLLFALRRDQTKCDRIKDLIRMNKELNKTRNQRLSDERHWFKQAGSKSSKK